MTLTELIPQIKEDLTYIFERRENWEFFINKSNLDEELNNWIQKDDDIVSFNVKESTDSFIIVIRHPSKNFPTFSIYRFFPSGRKWVVSADLQNGTISEMIQKIYFY